MLIIKDSHSHPGVNVALKSKAYHFAGGAMSAMDFRATLQAIEDNLHDGQEYPLDSIMDVLDLVGAKNVAMVREVPELKHALLHTVNAILRAHNEMSSPIDVPRPEDHNLLDIATGMQETLTRHQKPSLRAYREDKGESAKENAPRSGKMRTRDVPLPRPLSSWTDSMLRLHDPEGFGPGPGGKGV